RRLAAQAETQPPDGFTEWLCRRDGIERPAAVAAALAESAGTRRVEASMCLPAPIVAQLLGEAPSSRGQRLEAVLLAALLSALEEHTDWPAVLIDLGRHGRLVRAGDLDLTRTVGWFTELYPLAFAPSLAASRQTRGRGEVDHL